MKQLLITIAALVLVGCGPSVPDISIHEAAYDGNIEAVKQHLAAGTDVDKKGSQLGSTALHQAARKGRKEVANLLINKGADVNAATDYGVTPLHTSAGSGHKEIAELLIAKGANVNAKIALGPKQGLTALDAAIERNHPKIAALLRKHGAKTAEELKAEGK